MNSRWLRRQPIAASRSDHPATLRTGGEGRARDGGQDGGNSGQGFEFGHWFFSLLLSRENPPLVTPFRDASLKCILGSFSGQIAVRDRGGDALII
jgi:hypothetical protein